MEALAPNRAATSSPAPRDPSPCLSALALLRPALFLQSFASDRDSPGPAFRQRGTPPPARARRVRASPGRAACPPRVALVRPASHAALRRARRTFLAPRVRRPPSVLFLTNGQHGASPTATERERGREREGRRSICGTAKRHRRVREKENGRRGEARRGGWVASRGNLAAADHERGIMAGIIAKGRIHELALVLYQ